MIAFKNRTINDVEETGSDDGPSSDPVLHIVCESRSQENLELFLLEGDIQRFVILSV